MKTRVHLRIAKTTSSRAPYKVAATAKPNHQPITDMYGNAFPTVAFALDLNIPDGLFRQAERVIAEITVPEDIASIPVPVVVEMESE